MRETEPIANGPEAVSLDFMVEGGATLYGLAERCIRSIALHDTSEDQPYRLWTADHFPGDKPTTSMYGVSPIV